MEIQRELEDFNGAQLFGLLLRSHYFALDVIKLGRAFLAFRQLAAVKSLDSLES